MTLRLSTDAPVSHVLSGQAFVLTREHNFLLGADETLVATGETLLSVVAGASGP